jgi:hypothetical protein
MCEYANVKMCECVCAAVTLAKAGFCVANCLNLDLQDFRIYRMRSRSFDSHTSYITLSPAKRENSLRLCVFGTKTFISSNLDRKNLHIQPPYQNFA